MVLPFALLIGLAQSCAPSVAPETLLSVVRTESGFDPFTIGINGRPHRALHPATIKAAVSLAEGLLARGENLDLGLAQINSRNLPRLGLTLRTAFDPCRNLAGGARVLTANYLSAQRGALEAQTALRAALSVYNTGDPVRGLRNGYVTKVQAAAAVVVPAIAATRPSPAAEAGDAPVTLQGRPAGPVEISDAAPPVSLDVFARGAPAGLVWPSAPPRPSRRAGRGLPVIPTPGDPS